MNHDERDTHLARTMKAMAEIEAAVETPSRVETAVMANWDAAHAAHAAHARRDRSRTKRFVRATATAAGVALVGALAWQRGANHTADVPAGDTFTTVAVVGGPLLAGEPIRVVRMRVERSVLGDLGLPSSRPRDAARVEAAQIDTVDIDVLVGEDGVARAVRVPISEL
jgi:hypothetical protein